MEKFKTFIGELTSCNKFAVIINISLLFVPEKGILYVPINFGMVVLNNIAWAHIQMIYLG
jgi:hypothetical protein